MMNSEKNIRENSNNSFGPTFCFQFHAVKWRVYLKKTPVRV